MDHNSKAFCLASVGSAERRASTIERTCAFDTKFYKKVGRVFNVSALLILSKNNFNFFHFYSALPSLLVEILT